MPRALKASSIQGNSSQIYEYSAFIALTMQNFYLKRFEIQTSRKEKFVEVLFDAHLSILFLLHRFFVRLLGSDFRQVDNAIICSSQITIG